MTLIFQHLAETPPDFSASAKNNKIRHAVDVTELPNDDGWAISQKTFAFV
ncbi:hypothetical protein [Streptomyces chromofuscus]|nr:hypothetical protein [Streptomyces chromofuscus]